MPRGGRTSTSLGFLFLFCFYPAGMIAYLYNNQPLRFMFKVLVVLLVVGGLALDNGLGQTPPMGWNAWNRFKCQINEKIVRQTADTLVSSGLAAKGYKYVNLDDCWAVSRDPRTH